MNFSETKSEDLKQIVLSEKYFCCLKLMFPVFFITKKGNQSVIYVFLLFFVFPKQKVVFKSCNQTNSNLMVFFFFFSLLICLVLFALLSLRCLFQGLQQ